jgi:hypothetical protein
LVCLLREAKLAAHPDCGAGEQYVLCRSKARRQKEEAKIQLARQRLRARLNQTHASLQRRPVKDAGPVERPAAEKLLEVTNLG